MISTNTLRRSRRTRPQFPRGATSALPMTPPPAGSWRYPSERKSPWASAAAIVVAAGLHLALMYGFSTTPPRAVKSSAPVAVEAIQIEMPPVAPEEIEEMPTELAENSTPTIAVPQLAEVPSAVALSDFTQTIDLRPRAEIDPNALRSMTIPVNHGRGSGGLGANGTLFQLADLDRIPQVISQPSPVFPQKPGIENGVVNVTFVVDADGNVRDPRVVSSSDHDFEDAAVRGVKKWKFRPGVKAGRKVATLMAIPIRFELTDPAA